MASEGAIGKTGVDQQRGEAAGPGLAQVFGPEFAFRQHDGGGLQATVGQGAAGPEVHGEDADERAGIGVALAGQAITRAGRRGQDQLDVAGSPQLFKQGPNRLDFTHRDRLDPDPFGVGGEGGQEAQPLAKSGSVAPATHHPPQVIGRSQQKEREEEDAVDPQHEPRNVPPPDGLSAQNTPFSLARGGWGCLKPLSTVGSDRRLLPTSKPKLQSNTPDPTSSPSARSRIRS